MSAGTWALSREGLSDLRRYWKARPEELTVAELVAFRSTLPDDSATLRANSDSLIGLEAQLLCILIDSVRGLAAGLGGKRLKKTDLIAGSFSKQALEKKLHEEEEKEAVLAALRASKQ